jgi:UDP-2,3-diacylglucosamine pyrophosphatase LpxH
MVWQKNRRVLMENISHEISFDEVDYTKATYTAIVSDLHLCEAEPRLSKHPLWKKYKTREFFFDDQFRSFLEYIDRESGKDKVELVLNGDTFDFDSVMYLPPKPTYHISWLEKRRGLDPEEEKSVDKIKIILGDHEEWCSALHWFIEQGHRVVFVIGNHDLELHWKSVQIEILNFLKLTPEERTRIRFVEWFYISNKDTLIEHGNQYDPYCLCDDPVNPYVIDYNRVQVRLPFGDWACRYLVNGMGYFNPHVDSSFVMSLAEYSRYFFKYMIRAQPFIIWTWFWSSVAIFWRTLNSNLFRPLSDPLTVEKRVEGIAKRSNASPRMVRELSALFAKPAASSPLRIMKELWLDRAFLVLISLFVLLQLTILTKQIFDFSFYWIFIPIFILLPPFMLYARGVDSNISYYKKPNEQILTTSGLITQVTRIIYGHTHDVRHELLGGMEHLNSGTWSPAFADVECTISHDSKTFIWIYPGEVNRTAKVLKVENNQIEEFFGFKSK